MSFHVSIFFCVINALFQLGPASAICSCPDGWTIFGGSCYFFGHHDLDFQEAEKFCTHYGAHLVTLETRTENTFIESHLGNLKDEKHWIGLTDEIIEGVWKWYSTDTRTSYTDWGSGEPNQGRSANCGAIWASFGYKWVDEPCTRLFKPICEKNASVESEIVGK